MKNAHVKQWICFVLAAALFVSGLFFQTEETEFLGNGTLLKSEACIIDHPDRKLSHVDLCSDELLETHSETRNIEHAGRGSGRNLTLLRTECVFLSCGRQAETVSLCPETYVLRDGSVSSDQTVMIRYIHDQDDSKG